MVKLIIFLLSVVVSGCGEAFGCMECFDGASGAGVVECTKSEDCGGMSEESIVDEDCNRAFDAVGVNEEYSELQLALTDGVNVTEEGKAEIEKVSMEETDKKEKELKETAENTEPTDKNGEKENVDEAMLGDDNDDKNNAGDGNADKNNACEVMSGIDISDKNKVD